MDKHTKRYMFEFFKLETEEIDFFDLASFVDNADSSDDFVYLSFAADDIEDETQRKIIKERLLKKQLGWI